MTADTQQMGWTGSQVTQASGGRLVCGDSGQSFSGIAIDSRAISPHDLFVAIRGEAHDGHDFIGSVVQAGGAGLVIAEKAAADAPVDEWRRKGIFCVAVDDTIRALGKLAAYNQQRIPLSTVAITGSNGKTSTRKMVTAVLRRRFCTLATRGNFNNEIGLPLTLFRLRADHQWAVLEMGMNHPGEIRRLTEICRPDMGVVINVAPAHLEGVGSLEGVMAAKGELVEGLPRGSVAVLNGDDPMVRPMATRTGNRVCFFGRGTGNEIRAEKVTAGAKGTTFILVLPDASLPVTLKTPGEFMVTNALAAAAVGHLAGVPPEDIRGALEGFVPVKGRLNIIRLSGDICVIDDTYNANPASMRAAFQTLASLARGRRAILVTGDMRELGDHAQGLHHELGRAAAGIQPARIYGYGDFAETVAAGARQAGHPEDNIFSGSKDDILADLKKHLAPGDWILVKGSRAMQMEEIVQELVAWKGAATDNSQLTTLNSQLSTHNS